MHTFDDIYYSLLGEYTPEYALPWVENAFAPGSLCDQALTQIWDARRRLSLRLGTDEEDPDVMDILNAYEQIQKELCRRMYRMGKERPE